jgi:hypothetical protein
MQLSGPGQVTFADRESAATTVSFPLPSDHELELMASDSEYLVTSSVQVKVAPKPVNQAPTVTVSGPASIALPPGTATLTGSVRDDGLPVTPECGA